MVQITDNSAFYCKSWADTLNKTCTRHLSLKVFFKSKCCVVRVRVERQTSQGLILCILDTYTLYSIKYYGCYVSFLTDTPSFYLFDILQESEQEDAETGKYISAILRSCCFFSLLFEGQFFIMPLEA